MEIGMGIGTCGTAAYLGQRVIVKDTLTNDYWKPFAQLAQEAGLRACWAEPILSSRGKVLGTFAIYYAEPKSPQAEDFERMGYAANLAAVAIENRYAHEELERRAYLDHLTGLANRRRFDEVLAQEHARHARSGADLSLIMLDIDHFKAFNDGYGHVSGDDCLRRIARVIAGSVVRPADFAARYGGEEFACILPETGTSGAVAIAEKIRLGIMGLVIPHNFSPTADCVTVSIGVATITCSADEPASDLVVLADKMLYKAKAAGRNRVEVSASHFCPRPATDMEDNLVQLVWNASFCSGNHLIDTQHRELFNISNELLEAILSARPDGEISAIATRLLDDVAQHFHDEEAILELVNFPGLRHHAEEHARLYKMGVDLAQALDTKSAAVGDVFKFLVDDVVLQHMLAADREFFPFIGDKHAA
jgi:diguanylate cyclase (GGDEF)-like protein/hemerythrin-like metal-binding protein